jgi:LPS-assembly protein
LTFPRLLFVCLSFWAIAIGATRPAAQTVTTPGSATAVPMLFKADSLRHDRDLGVIVANGNVEVDNAGRILRADTVSYNQRRNLLTATGNISLMEPGGDVFFADHVELSGDFKDGIIENIRILLSDNSRIAAAGGRRSGGTIMEMTKGVYSPCQKCVADDGTPFWQLKALRVTHNQKEQEIEYRDVTLEILGFPIFYTPYLTHPDPTVKRKSGFLTPRYGNDSNLGLIIETPYYFNIAPDKDATLRPIITSDEGPVLAGQYRQRFTNGHFEIDASSTYGSDDSGDKSYRAHAFVKTRFDLDDTWRAGADIQLATDDTYLRRYGFDSTDTLRNHFFLEGFRGQSYVSAEAFYWQGLREQDDPGEMPIIAPMLDFSTVSDPGPTGARWTFDANGMILTRTSGTDSRRLSLKTGWRLPTITPIGEVYSLYAELQTDIYHVNGVQEAGNPAGEMTSGITGRVFPRIGLDWRFPMARQGTETTQIIEPVAGIMISPNGGNPEDIPNEDSKDLEFDDTNLFSPNRFTGLDRVEGGQRLYYGLNMGVYGPKGYSSAFIGQSFRLRKDSTFAAGSGLEDNFSDVVGRVRIAPSTPVKLEYRFRLDKNDLSPLRNEVDFSIGPRALNLDVNYSFFDQGTGSGEFSDREELTVSLNSRITPDWSMRASTRRDMINNASLRHALSLTFECDCYQTVIEFSRKFTQDRDVRPTDTIFIRFIFKNLGEIQTATGA